MPNLEPIPYRKKIVYEDRPADLPPLQVEESVASAPPQDSAPVELGKTVEPEAPQEEGMSQFKRSALIGATPLLFGILSGNTVEGAQVAGDNLLAEDKIARDAATKSSKGDLERSLAKLRLERELAKTATEKEKQRTAASALLEDKHMTEVNVDGKPVLMTNTDANGKIAYKNAKDINDFHLDDKMKLETHKAGLKTKEDKTLDPYKMAKNENELYRMYQKDSNTTQKMAEAYSRFQGTMTRPSSGANDLAVVFNFMKTLDPGSTVREGEQASAANAGSIPGAVWVQYNRLLDGSDKKLPEGLREKFFNEATAMYKQQLKAQAQIDEHFKGVTSRRGMDARNVVRAFPAAKEVDERVMGGVVNYVNKEGKSVQIDTSKLTPRMKRDLQKDGFSPAKGK